MMGGVAPRLPACPSRCSFPATASSGSLRTGVAAAGFGFSPVVLMGGVARTGVAAAGIGFSPSWSSFPASASSALGLRSRTRPIRCSSRTSQEEPPAPPPPQRSYYSKFQEGWKELRVEARKNAFKLVLLIVAIVLAKLSFSAHPYSGEGHACFFIAMCERSEKIVKFVLHVAPIVAAFWKGYCGQASKDSSEACGQTGG